MIGVGAGDVKMLEERTRVGLQRGWLLWGPWEAIVSSYCLCGYTSHSQHLLLSLRLLLIRWGRRAGHGGDGRRVRISSQAFLHLSSPPLTREILQELGSLQLSLPSRGGDSGTTAPCWTKFMIEWSSSLSFPFWASLLDGHNVLTLSASRFPFPVVFTEKRLYAIITWEMKMLYFESLFFLFNTMAFS